MKARTPAGSPYRLITIGASHYCEKARWVLSRARVPFVEEAHFPVFHYLASRRAGGGRTVPVLVTDSDVLLDSTDIVELADRHAGGAIYGSGETRREAKALEDTFDERLGPATRRIAYFHILDHKQLVLDAFGDGVPKLERVALSGTFPMARTFIRRGLNVTAEATRRSESRVDEIFDDVDARLADGRRFLTGDEFTAADLTFASLAAPVVLPPGYGAPLPPFDRVPQKYAEIVRRRRDTPAGQFALKLYEQERSRVLRPAS